MAARPRHPKKEVEDALADAEAAGWTVTPTSSGHRWGVMRCAESSRSGCQVSIWSTPRNPGVHERQLRHVVGSLPGIGSEEVPADVDLSLHADRRRPGCPERVRPLMLCTRRGVTMP